MRFKSLTINGNVILNNNKIEEILMNDGFFWLIDSEIDNAHIEIKNKTIIWHSGDFYSGDWYYGIFKSGNFYGKFINGIFSGGNFQGKWISGINLQQEVDKN